MDAQNGTFFTISGPLLPRRAQQEVRFTLYLHQIYGDRIDRNQVVVVNPNLNNCFGLIAINDWIVREGPEPDSNIVAHAQGLHTGSGKDKEKWYSSFNMLFEDQRFNGSSLQIQGSMCWYPNSVEWAVVGGTGEFIFAQGTVSGDVIRDHDNYRVMKLSINIVSGGVSEPEPEVEQPEPEPEPEPENGIEWGKIVRAGQKVTIILTIGMFIHFLLKKRYKKN